MERVPQEAAVIGGIVKGARVAGRIAGRAGKAAAKRGAVQAAGQAGKIIKTATRFATKLPGKIKGEVVKEIAKRGGVKEAGKALVKKVIKDQALAQSKKVVKNFIADSQNSKLNQIKDEERAIGVSLALMKEAERKKLIPRGSTPNLRQLERAVLESREYKDIVDEEQKKIDKDVKEFQKRAIALRRTFEESRLRGLKQCATFEKNRRGENVACRTFKKEGEPKWFKETYCKTGETRSACSNKKAALSGNRYYKQYLPAAIKGLPKNDPRRIKYEKEQKQKK
jgi:hypothetical protein